MFVLDISFFVRYVIVCMFSQYIAYFFVILTVSFTKQKVLILVKSVFLFSCVKCAFTVRSKNSLLTPGHKFFPPVFYSRRLVFCI